MEPNLDPPDPILVENIVNHLKSHGIFDEFRRECLADVDTKSSFQNLGQRVDGFTSKFLAKEKWTPDTDKNDVRAKLRKHIDESGMLDSGVDHFIEQVIQPQINQLLLPKISEVVNQYLDNEKLKIKQETVGSEKISTETITETKTIDIDPIADILSFTCSKPVASTSVQTKVFETSNVEKKKEVAYQTKTLDPTPKTKKKKGVVQPTKTPDALLKVKKRVSDQTLAGDIALNFEKEEVSHSSIKKGTVELPKEVSSVPTLQTKSLDDSKELEKVVKPVKVAACETGFETPKKVVKENVKHEKMKVDNLKLQIPEKLLQSEENSENKSSPTVKSNSSSKSKLESPKKNKPLGLGVIRTPSKVVESPKSNVRESSDSSSDKISMDQSKVSAKLPNVSSKECSSPLKNTISPTMVMCKKGGDSVSKSKPKGTLTKSSEECSSPLKNTISPTMVMCEKGGDSVSKNKFKGTPTKSSDKPEFLKVGSLRKDSSVKFKHSSEKHEKAKTIKSSDSKPDAKIQSESSLSSDKGSKQNYSSSYDISNGSDSDRSFSSVSSKEKVTHFNKHQREDSSSADSIDKPSSEKKRIQSDSDLGAPEKDMGQKASKYQTGKQSKSFTVQESAKISSRSDISTASSTSNSQASLKESSVSIASGETSESSSKNSEKKKPTSKDKEQCSGSQNLPPPSPPPPTSGLPMASSTEMSSMDEILSSQESEFELSGNSDEEVSSDSGEENLNQVQPTLSSNQELHNEIQDMSQFSSSSSDFEGFYSPLEKEPRSEIFSSDVSVSSVHTSDLSSFEDAVSDVDCSKDESGKEKSKKKFTIKEAKEILKARAEQQHLDALKTVSQKQLEDKKNRRSSLQNSAIGIQLSEIEVSPAPEPKRESRRERKLNPKYASNEYTSIFDSKCTSFLKKQSIQNKVKLADSKKIEADLLPAKGTMPAKQKSAVTAPGKTLSNNVGSKVPAAKSGKNLISLPSASESVRLELSSEDISQTKMPFIASDKSPNTLSETGSPNTIALKIKLSPSKYGNETNKDPNVLGTKRKFEDKRKFSAKKVCCQQNSVNSSSLESIAKQNKPFNNKSKLPSTVLSVGRENGKDFS